MRTQTIRRKLYKFSELSEQAKEKAVEEYANGGLDYDWWDCTYDEARRGAGLIITSFDDYTIEGKLEMSMEQSIAAILKDHGEPCDTYQLAVKYKKLMIVDRCTRRLQDDEYWEDENEDLAEEYKKKLLKIYLKMLQAEAEYLQSDEYIREWLSESDYEYLRDGSGA